MTEAKSNAKFLRNRDIRCLAKGLTCTTLPSQTAFLTPVAYSRFFILSHLFFCLGPFPEDYVGDEGQAFCMQRPKGFLLYFPGPEFILYTK